MPASLNESQRLAREMCRSGAFARAAAKTVSASLTRTLRSEILQ
ncbi:hypothetical protein HMPREF1508_0270 [Shuttleworthella sp. MSX8B]|nr:hypothetical protein HMPREF1508_0270 [Shuttleworthia sp. MSX8B]